MARGAARMAVASNRRWIAFVVGRESLLLWFCFLGSWLFLNHGLLYLQPRVQTANAPPQAYALTAAVIYIFVRGISLVVETRLPPPVRAETPRPKEPAPLAVKPVRRIVSRQDGAAGPLTGDLLRNAVISAQAILPATGDRGPTAFSALAHEPPVGAHSARARREPWRPTWMAEPPRRS